MKRQMEVIRKNQMKLPEWKNIILKMKNYCMGLITDRHSRIKVFKKENPEDGTAESIPTEEKEGWPRQ